MLAFLTILLSTFTLSQDIDLLNEELRHEFARKQDFDNCLALYECYASYQFDSAYAYAMRLEQLALEQGNPDQIVIAHIKKAFVYFSAGLFKEAHDELANIHELDLCTDATRTIYNTYYARLCFDLATYAGGIIEHEQQLRERRQQRLTYILLAIIVLAVLLLAAGIIYLRHEMRRLSKAHETIHHMNQQLSEVGKIKEEYIGTFLAWQSDTVHDIDSAHTHLMRLARERDINQFVAYINSIPKRNRREEFMQRFDLMFLRICPDFVSNFNALLQPEYRITLREGELLPPELRIFALVRLGISSNEKIAQILDYSVNTVYTYKTKMRNRSLLDADTFYASIAHC